MSNQVVDNQGNIWNTNVTSEYDQVINMMPVYIKKLKPDAKIPSHGSAAAAGYDLHACLEDGVEGVYIEPYETKLIGTGLAFAIPESTFLGIYARSGLASKKGLRPANCVGIIDSDYRGEVMIAIHNDTQNKQYIENGERIAQGVLQHYMPMDFKEVDSLPDTDRGLNGFGSTGSK